MTCEELQEDYGAYALRSLEEPELGELRAHLGRNCENCMPGVREAEDLVARMAAAVEIVEPPKNLRTRVIALVSPNAGRKHLGWMWALAAAFSLFVAVALGIMLQVTNTEILKMQALTQQQRGEVARLNETLALFEDPTAKEVTFGKGARGRVVISPRHGVAFSGQNLAALAPGKTYEMWIIPKGGKPVPAGTFAPQSDGSAMHVQSGPVDVASTAAVAVSIENEGGVAQPTADQIIIVAPVGQ